MKGVGARRFDYGSSRKLVTREIYVNGNEEQERAIVVAGLEDNHGGSGFAYREFLLRLRSFLLLPSINVLVVGTFR